MILKKIKEKEHYILFLFLSSIFIICQSHSVYGGDSGDLLTAMATGSFAHPPGYPLYSLIGNWLLKLPINTPAWRGALLSSIPSSLALTFWFLLLNKYFSKLISLVVVIFTAFLYPIFLYSCVTEVFALNTLFNVMLVFFCHTF